jgi:hypothetical protein
VISIPDISLIPFDSVQLHQPPKLVLKRLRLVVLFLIVDVRGQLPGMGRRHGKRSIPCLTLKLRQASTFVLDPLRRLAFDLTDEIGNGDRPPESTENVDVILNASDSK